MPDAEEDTTQGSAEGDDPQQEGGAKAKPNLPPLPVHPAEQKKMGELSKDDKYELLDKYRSDGNIYLKAGFYEEALKKYSEGMTFVKHCIREDTDEERSKRGRVLIHANKAAVYFKMGEYRQCIDSCNDALEEDPSYVKAHFRKGKAYVKLDNFDEARACFKKVEALNGGTEDPALRKELTFMQRAQKVQDKKDAILS